jgi:hypothetical protein
MSEYGRLWEEARVVRDELKQLIPGIDASTLGAACVSFEAKSEEMIKDLEARLAQAKLKLAEWADLEQSMGRTE